MLQHLKILLILCIYVLLISIVKCTNDTANVEPSIDEDDQNSNVTTTLGNIVSESSTTDASSQVNDTLTASRITSTAEVPIEPETSTTTTSNYSSASSITNSYISTQLITEPTSISTPLVITNSDSSISFSSTLETTSPATTIKSVETSQIATDSLAVNTSSNQSIITNSSSTTVYSTPVTESSTETSTRNIPTVCITVKESDTTDNVQTASHQHTETYSSTQISTSSTTSSTAGIVLQDETSGLSSTLTTESAVSETVSSTSRQMQHITQNYTATVTSMPATPTTIQQNNTTFNTSNNDTNIESNLSHKKICTICNDEFLLVMMIMLPLLNIIAVGVTAVVVHRIVSRRRSWRPPSVRYLTANAELRPLPTPLSGVHLASDEICMEDEEEKKKREHIPVIGRDSGWCIPFTKKEKQKDSGV